MDDYVLTFMASVVKDPRGRSPYWIACYTDSTGRRLKKSTKLTNKKNALEVALALEHGEEQARQGVFTEARLRDLLEQTLERVVGVPVQHYTIETWLHWWHERKSKARPASAERYGQVVRDFIESLGARAKLPLEHIDADKDVLAFRNAEIKRGVSNKTANLAVKIISMAFHDALRQGKIKFNPCVGLDALQEDAAEREPFTSEEIKQLLKSAKGDWKAAILFAYYTGARLSDIASMQWSAIDLDKRLISFTPKKTKRGKKVLRIPLHPDLEKELLNNPGVGNAPLFPSLIGRRSGGAHGLSSAFAAIMRTAGVHGEVIRHTAKGRGNRTKSFHSLRHSFNSALANAGIARELRQVLTGHASERMNEIYTHRELEPLRDAIGTLPRL
jgi:integrase